MYIAITICVYLCVILYNYYIQLIDKSYVVFCNIVWCLVKAWLDIPYIYFDWIYYILIIIILILNYYSLYNYNIWCLSQQFSKNSHILKYLLVVRLWVILWNRNKIYYIAYIIYKRNWILFIYYYILIYSFFFLL